MHFRKCVCLLLTSLFCLPVCGFAQGLSIKQFRRAVAPITVQINKILNAGMEKQFRVNCKTEIKWNGVPKAYGTIWLSVCKPDKKTCGGDFPVRNIGAYTAFRSTQSMTGQDWVIKVATQDKKYAGFSNTFFVDGMLPHCCADGWLLPPCP